jgi:peptidoglycan/LPS O-acetylase OafA/YrhL
MDAIAMGCLTALIVHGRSTTRTMNRALALAGLVLMSLCLVFEPGIQALRLEELGLDMTVVAVGACLVMAAAAKSGWKLRGPAGFLLIYGRQSYEIYLTHMFMVLACFALFRQLGQPMSLVLPAFIVIGALAGILGKLVARFYSEPVNRALRGWFGDAPGRLGSVVEGESKIIEEAHHV